jgi:hypothetical protein
VADLSVLTLGWWWSIPLRGLNLEKAGKLGSFGWRKPKRKPPEAGMPDVKLAPFGRK